jgi:hypothetical protein
MGPDMRAKQSKGNMVVVGPSVDAVECHLRIEVAGNKPCRSLSCCI